MVDQPPTREPLVGAELRQASRFALRLAREQGQVCQRILRLVDIGFPELAEVWDDPTCMAVLRRAPTARAVARMSVEKLAQLRRPGNGGRAIGPGKAAELTRLAATSVAAPELEAQVGFEMRLLIGQYDLLEQQIRETDRRVAALLDGEVAQLLLTIPGVGPSTAGVLMAEIGDIWRFTDVDQLLAYAGVHPREQSSGKKGANPETSWVMAKTGNAFLREAAYRMAVVGIQHNPVIRAHYARKRAAGKSRMNAVGHCMSKALSLVWGVWRGGKAFDAAHGSAAKTSPTAPEA
jgi:transposase